MKLFSLALAATLLLPPAAQAFRWPGNARAAVSLAYDDALDSQLDNAIPVLDRYGLRGSFYLQLSNPAPQLRMGEWRAAAQRGHELGNHSLFHQCVHNSTGRAWVQPHRNLATTSAGQMADQVRLGNTMLTAIDGKYERTYSAPCGDLDAGGKPYLPLLQDAFVGIKAGGADGVQPQIAGLGPVPVHAPVGLTGQQLIAMVKEAGARGTMLNLTFHGIGGDYLTVSKEAHEELVRFLAEHKDEYWTDTFLNIMQYAKAPGWVLDWSDEFDGTALDRTTWVEETGGGGWGNNELQFYTTRRENVRVADGRLVIEARKEAYEHRGYTSARLKTAGLMERQYGRFEARIKVPRGQGIWPAFWMLGADIAKTGWPRSGEIDIMENIGKEPGIVHGTVHGPGYSGDKSIGKPSALADATYADDFHIFAVEWEPKEIRWYRDGILYHTARPDTVPGDWVFEHPFFLLVNLAVGGYWPGNPDASTVFPQRMLVDYVRVYRRAAP
jgi:peptidoglycan/xylan/chitin deacetylase (PgdA/CDA1 family)